MINIIGSCRYSYPINITIIEKFIRYFQIFFLLLNCYSCKISAKKSNLYVAIICREGFKVLIDNYLNVCRPWYTNTSGNFGLVAKHTLMRTCKLRNKDRYGIVFNHFTFTPTSPMVSLLALINPSKLGYIY